MVRREYGEIILFKLLALLFSFYSVIVAAEISQDEILEKLKKLGESDVETYVSEMEEIGGITSEYIRNKEQECSGEYSSMVLGGTGEKKEVRKKLTKKEKSLCLYLLVDFRIKVTRLSFDIRKKHLQKMQERQLLELEAIRNREIKDLEKLSQKYK